ncbi:MAG: hydrolase [Flavobacteriales bacterium]|jgi:nicotinamidase-related amidase|nr:MAG: hydrolase [Flavobacteriales bacterium]
MLIQREASLLLVIDIQEKLAPAIFEGERVVRNSVRLLQGAQQLGVPCYIAEHCASSIGPTLPEIRNATVSPIFLPKTHFSCAAEPGALDVLRATGRRQVVLVGMECHVCVLQSAFGLREAGFDVFVAADATSSRTPENHQAGVERMRADGIHVVSTEMVIFEWLHRAATDDFRALLPLLR